MCVKKLSFFVLWFVVCCPVHHAQEALPKSKATNLAVVDPAHPEIRQLELREAPANGMVTLRGPLPSIIKVWWKDDAQHRPLEFGFNKDASEVVIYVPQAGSPKTESNLPPTLRFLVTDATTVFENGVVVLSALDSQVIGKQAKLETHPGTHRIGFWGNADDYVVWDFTAPSGEYECQLVYSRATPDGTEVEITVDESTFPLALKTTGTWYRYRVVAVGDLSLKADQHHAEVRVKKIVNGGVMNLKAIVLTPKVAK